ncbi:MAG: hypothetical protein IJ497_00490 [Clostridia bacterium]|nr:hypothetical protein [Clostridia bacterium]
MSVKQLSIFAENRNGAIYEITKILANAGIAIRAFSIADTQNYGVLRLIVSDVKAAAGALSEAGKIVNVTDVIGVEISDANGGLCELLHEITKDAINVEYLYAFVAPTAGGKAFVVLRVADNDVTEKVLTGAGFTLLTDDDLKL